jgi:carbon monoxide dehydrogenase subunit G
LATLKIVRNIHAPAAVVFDTVADPAHFSEAISGVTKLEFLSSTKSGAGTRFRQSRVMNGKEMTLDFDVTESVPNQRVRIVNEVHGTRWDSLITLTPSNALTTLTMRMDTETRPLVARLLMPLMLRLFIRKAVEKDFDAVKAYCERSSAS